MPLLCGVCLSLSLAEGNKELLIKSPLLESFLAFLHHFKDLDPPVTGPKAANAKFPWEAAFNPSAATTDDVETVNYIIGMS